MPTQYKILSKNIAYQGYFRIEAYELQFEKYDGNLSAPVKREIFERGIAVAVLPYDPILDKVVLIEQFRIGALKDDNSPWLLEVVAGIIEPGETPAEVARRETKEESGLDIQTLIPITKYWVSPGGTTETVDLFCAKVDASQAGGVFGLDLEDEDVKALAMSTEEAFAKVRSGEIRNAPSIIALQWLELNKAIFEGR